MSAQGASAGPQGSAEYHADKAIPDELRIFSDYMTYILLSRENVSTRAALDLKKRIAGFEHAHPKLRGCALLTQVKSCPGTYFSMTVLGIEPEVESTFGDFPEKEKEQLRRMVNKMFGVVAYIADRWSKEFPRERIRVKFHKDKQIMSMNENSKSGAGFRTLRIKPGEEMAATTDAEQGHDGYDDDDTDSEIDEDDEGDDES
jgi:hypothetical protein